MKTDVYKLPVMEKCCGTCPFKKDKDGKYQNESLANTVIQRNLFNSQQICHGTEKGPKRIPQNRCRGYFDYSFQLYYDMGLDPEKNLLNNPKTINLIK